MTMKLLMPLSSTATRTAASMMAARQLLPSMVWNQFRTASSSSSSIVAASSRLLLQGARVTALQQQSALSAVAPATAPILSIAARSLSSNAQQSAEPKTTKLEVVKFLRLNNLADNPGAVPRKRRVGRGPGSSKGKTCGRGHKGQKARSGGKVHPTFEGGQTKLYKRIPKRGFTNKFHGSPMHPLNMGTLQDWIDMGRFKKITDRSSPDVPITLNLTDMVEAGLIKPSAIDFGVKLLARDKEEFRTPNLHLHISRASEAAIEAMEAAGSKVTTIHYNELALKYMLRAGKKKYQDEQGNCTLPKIKFARPPPKWQPYYTGWKNRGYLNPMVQLKNWFDKNKYDELEQKFETILQENEPEIAEKLK